MLRVEFVRTLEPGQPTSSSRTYVRAEFLRHPCARFVLMINDQPMATIGSCVYGVEDGDEIAVISALAGG
jgi:hypothetical protein